MFLLPWCLRKPYVQWVVSAMRNHAPESNPHLEERIQETLHLAEELKRKNGQWPALLVVLSHPETVGPLEWLRFEVMRQALVVADAFVEARRPGRLFHQHPQCLLAIDPFALDTVSAAVGGFYGAWMNQIYLAYDRQPSTQSWSQRRLFLRGTDFSHIGWKLLRLLKTNVPVLLALGGGLPYNARLLYCAREWVQRLQPKTWRVSKRAAQLELMEILMNHTAGVWPAERGEIPHEAQHEIRAALSRWGLESQGIEAVMEELREEFQLPVPYRARLLRVLQARLAARGKPLILVPVSHRDQPPHVMIRSPLTLESETRDFRPFFSMIANIFATSASKG